MCQTNECAVYLPMFAEAIVRRRATVWTLVVLLGVSLLVGVALLLTAFFLSPVAGFANLEMFKGGLGFVVTAFAVPVAKDVLDRWVALVPIETVCNALQNCAELPQADLEVQWAIAKELAKKL